MMAEATAGSDKAHVKPRVERKKKKKLVESKPLKLQLNILDKIQTYISNGTWGKYLLLFFLPSITFFDKKTLLFLNELSLPDSQSL